MQKDWKDAQLRISAQAKTFLSKHPHKHITISGKCGMASCPSHLCPYSRAVQTHPVFRFSVRFNQLLNGGKCPKPFCLCWKVSACHETPALVLVLQEQRSQPQVLKNPGYRIETWPGPEPPAPALPRQAGTVSPLLPGSQHAACGEHPTQALCSRGEAPGVVCTAHETWVSPRSVALTGTGCNGSSWGEHSVAM